MNTQPYHISALLDESINGLNINPEGVYVDVTFGGGGHSRAIMEHLGQRGRLLAFDQDIDAYSNRLIDKRFTFVHSNFSFLKNFLRFHDVESVDGILADLGVSFHHFDEGDRGFSFRYDSRLDMRMNRSSGRDASTVLMTSSEESLATMFYLYGELKQSRALARAIVDARANGAIDTTGRLVEVVSPYIRKSQEKKELSQVFQALRIEVNNELEVLKKLLSQSLEVLNSGGRLVVLTYHSLEDRLVKNFMRSGNVEGKVVKDFYGKVITPWKVVNSKVITASEAEVLRNPRSRSAKLRIAEKL